MAATKPKTSKIRWRTVVKQGQDKPKRCHRKWVVTYLDPVMCADSSRLSESTILNFLTLSEDGFASSPAIGAAIALVELKFQIHLQVLHGMSFQWTGINTGLPEQATFGCSNGE